MKRVPGSGYGSVLPGTFGVSGSGLMGFNYPDPDKKLFTTRNIRVVKKRDISIHSSLFPISVN